MSGLPLSDLEPLPFVTLAGLSPTKQETKNIRRHINKLKTNHSCPRLLSGIVLEKSWPLYTGYSQRSNTRRVRSSRHNSTKENTDKCRKFHFNRKT